MLFAHPTDPAQARAAWIRDLAALTLVIGAFFLLFLGHRPLAVPSEARYAELAREIVTSGDWITPRINGTKYFEKPPLFYWIEAIAVLALGLSEFALRLTTALFALGGCLLAYVGGRKLFDRTTGILSAVVLASSLLWFALSRVILLDVPVGFFLSLCVLAFIFAVRSEAGSGARTGWLYTMYVAAAAATLTKGLIGIVLPGLVIGMWIVLTWNWRLLLEVRLLSGLALFLLVTVPWHLAVGFQTPEFFHFYFIHEHWERFTTTIHGRAQPWWFFLAILAGGVFPWVGFLFQALWRNIERAFARDAEGRAELFLALWFWLILLFFSVSDSKLVPYVTTIMVPLAIFLGRYLALAFASPEERPGLRIGLWLVSGTAAAISLLALVVGIFGDRLAPADLADDIERARPLMGWLCAGSLVAALAVAWALRNRGPALAFAFSIVAAGIFFHGVDTSMAQFQPRSIKPLAQEILARAAPGDEVMAYRTYPQDLPVYLNRRISVMGWSGELDFGREIEPATQAWMFDDEAEFWRRWNGEGTVYMIVPTHFEATVRPVAGQHYHEIARTPRHILAVNKAD
ncbi:MAG: phospholipid carrier-dependent glycosyltransferase [Proteobacteria bacterium]|nr:phospholipid carrier-dependent glycosyltransferase [Pseudomonadota bacterium]